MDTVTLTLPDGTKKGFNSGISAAEAAAKISPRLSANAVAVLVDNVLVDLSRVVEADCVLRFITREDEESLELIRHDLAHVMAQAVTELFPAARPTIGPVVENGFYYDFDCPEAFTPANLERVEERMRTIVDDAVPLVREVWERGAVRDFFAERNEKFKVELVDAIPDGEEVTMYRQGDFIDLCRGPHMPTTRHAGKAFKLMRVAGSYWRGDSRRERLQRIYGTAWRTPAELRGHLRMIEEAERRDHRKLGVAMGLFHFQDAAAGSVFWHGRGLVVYRKLEEYVRARQELAGYVEVRTPQLVERSLWELSGHWDKFRDNMYLVENESGVAAFASEPERARVFGLKPMNCPCHVLIYRRGVKSYRDLPLRMAEFGCCHRCEPAGALHGLMRMRSFTQDDAHIFCTPEQVTDETVSFMRLLSSIYQDLGFNEFTVKLADRPPVRAGEDEVWDSAEAALRKACEEAEIDWQANPGEGAFYGPKLEFVLRDAIGRQWQCGTWQVDFVLPGRLGAEYVNASGARCQPVMLHRAILGSFERFLGILIEHTNGRLPLWLAPVQVVVATVTSAGASWAVRVLEDLRAAGLRSEMDGRNEKISYKIREHSAAKVPLIAVVGEREASEGSLSVRRLGSRSSSAMSLEEAIGIFAAEAQPPHQKEGQSCRRMRAQ